MNLNTLPPLLRGNLKHTLFCSISNLPFQLHHITPILQIKKIIIYRTYPTFCSHSKRGENMHVLKLCKMSITSQGFPGGSVVKNLPAMLETQVRSLVREDPQKETAIHSSILAWRIPWTEEPGRLQSMGLQELDRT